MPVAEKYWELKAANRCVNCTSNLAPGEVRICEKCREKINVASLAWYHKQVETGVCPKCGDDAIPNRVFCGKCALQDTLRIKEGKGWIKRHQDHRLAVFAHYGMKCVCCEIDDLNVLTIDHIDGKGAEHRREFHLGQSSTTFYRWLVSNNFPEGFQTLCIKCNAGKHLNGGVCPHVSIKEPPLDTIKHRYHHNLKIEVFDHYGGKCEMCGETRLPFLNIDHIEGRRAMGHDRVMGGHRLYQHLRSHDYPSGYRVLCYNDNRLVYLQKKILTPREVN